MKTSDLERAVVLAQNDALRDRCYSRREPELFQRLRRCCICLRSRCKEPAKCRSELETWTQKKWDAAVDAVLAKRGIKFSVDDG